MTDVLIGFESGGNSVKGVKYEVSDPVGEGGEEGDLNLMVIDGYVCDDECHWWYWLTIS